MTYAYPSPSFVLPPLPPGFAWAWTARGWIPTPYTGPAWAPFPAAAAPSSPAPSSTPASSPHTPQEPPELLADVSPWIAALSEEDALVGRALGDLYDARAAQLAAKHRAARVILRHGPPPIDGQSDAWIAQLARDRADVAEALRAWEEAKRAAELAEAAVTAAAQRSSTHQQTLTAAPIPAGAPAPAPASASSAPAPPTEALRPDNAPHGAPAADWLADVPPQVAELAERHAPVARALGDLHAARAARRTAELHAARLITSYGPAPTGAQSTEWITQLARARPDVAEALQAGARAVEAAARAEAALSLAIASSASPNGAPDTSDPPAAAAAPRPLEPQEHALEGGNEATALGWARRVAERDPHVAQALGHYLAAEEASRGAGERFAAVLARHGPLPEGATARAEWVRGLAERDPHAAAALRAGLAALEGLERASAQLAEALSAHARAPPPMALQ